MNLLPHRLPGKTRLYIKYVIDLILWGTAAPLAFWLRLDNRWLYDVGMVVEYSLVGLAIKAALVYLLRLYRQSWRRVAVSDLYFLLQGAGFSTLIMLALGFVVYHYEFLPRSIPLLEGLLALVLLGGVRLAARLWYEGQMRLSMTGKTLKVLVVGAGDAGAMIVREMLAHPESARKPIGILDDEPSKQGTTLMGVEVWGKIDDLPEVVRRFGVNEVLIAMPSAPGSVIRRVVDLARECEVKYRIIPGVHDIIDGRVSISQIREVRLEDLLRREPVSLNLEEIAGYLDDRVILITGAGGSIGSELVRQIARFHPTRVVLLGHGEHSLYKLERELDRSWPELSYSTVIANLQSRRKIAHVVEHYRPGVIFHAAAHKHVPLMEMNPDEAILNNVGGTKNLVDAALDYGVTRFINISTDKAVNPTSVMGASKRIAEYLVQWASQQVPEGHIFASVRFGNVLGSRGSVVPLFQEQIRCGGPVTVTDPDMTRYFMTIPEASQLVLEAGGLGENGVVYVLDMGEPVKIITLARDLIELSGLVPDEDIEVKFAQIRPGEKLYEELFDPREGMVRSSQPKIFVARQNGLPEGDVVAVVEQLLSAAAEVDVKRVRDMLKKVVPGYHVRQDMSPSPSILRNELEKGIFNR
ncbi:MAG: polysaccharide biosynthesis protein [Anaerolineae bacterium]|nr:polysaccharide biosynthesis protein [Anaerolineae bacterium]